MKTMSWAGSCVSRIEIKHELWARGILSKVSFLRSGNPQEGIWAGWDSQKEIETETTSSRTYNLSNTSQRIETVYICVLRFPHLVGASFTVHGERGGTFQKEENRKGPEYQGFSLCKGSLLHRCWPTGSYSKKCKVMGVEEDGWKGLMSVFSLIQSCCAIGTMLNIRSSVVSKIDVFPAFSELTIQWTIGGNPGIPKKLLFYYFIFNYNWHIVLY